MKISKIKVKSLNLINEKIIENIINIQYDYKEELYNVWYIG